MMIHRKRCCCCFCHLNSSSSNAGSNNARAVDGSLERNKSNNIFPELQNYWLCFSTATVLSTLFSKKALIHTSKFSLGTLFRTHRFNLSKIYKLFYKKIFFSHPFALSSPAPAEVSPLLSSSPPPGARRRTAASAEAPCRLEATRRYSPR